MISRLFVLVLVLAGCASIGAAAPHVSHSAARSELTYQPASLARLVSRPDSVRDLYTLTDQLRLRPPRLIPHMVRHTSPNYAVGHQDSFYVLSEDSNRYFTVHATVRAKTAHLYIYVQNGLQVDQAAVQKSAQLFERSTYPTDRSFFGTEWSPGVDDDVHITCLVADLKSAGVGGYFSAEDEYPRLVNPYSNEREMFYIDSNGAPPGDPYFDSTLAHEFQHMIHWYMHPHENLWLNEGMSMLAEAVNHFTPTSEPDAYVSAPGTQLNTWNETASASVAHYGAAYLFLSYLYNRFGRGFIREMLADRKYTDLALVDDVLHKRGISTTADKLYAQWVVANYVDDRSLAGSTYAYPQLPHTVQAQESLTLPVGYHTSISPYSPRYIVVNGVRDSAPLTVKFAGHSTVPAVGVPKFPGGSAAPFWWSMRGDMTDTRLVRTVDLTRVHRASLHFWTWYDIETNYDYGYVEASTDGGKTWTPLPGTHTTRANPNGASYGPAYTGTLKKWHQETVSLSRFAGRKIQLRFQYITDEGYNGQSWAVKDISIPEIGFHDRYTGWSPQGFVAVGRNALPDTWTVQLMEFTAGGVKVERVPLRNNAGSVVIDPRGTGLKRLELVVYNAAPKTTVKSPFTLSVR